MITKTKIRVASMSTQQIQLLMFCFITTSAILLLFISNAQGSSILRGPNSQHPYPIPKALVNPNIEYNNQAESLHKAIQEMAVQLFQNLEEPDPVIGELAEGLAVTTFVDLKKLTRTSSFGRYLSEQLMTEFQQHGFTVVEIRKSSKIIVQEKRGEYGLSRDLDEIPTEVAARTLVTGTYTVAGDHILVNAKVIDNKTNQLLSSATLLFPKNSLAEVLLADSASASSRNKEVTYMKRLEL